MKCAQDKLISYNETGNSPMSVTNPVQIKAVRNFSCKLKSWRKKKVVEAPMAAITNESAL